MSSLEELGVEDVQLSEEEGRRLQSATEADWRNRMVFFPGDERQFYYGLDGTACEPTSAIYDPACRSIRKTHREVAYARDDNPVVLDAIPGRRGYGTYRRHCTESSLFHAHVCQASSLVPARELEPIASVRTCNAPGVANSLLG